MIVAGQKSSAKSPKPPREEPNTLQSRATLRAVHLLSAGPIGGLVDGEKSVILDDVPLVAENGEKNFKGVRITERRGEPDQAYVPGFPAVETMSPQLRLKVEAAHPPVQRVVTTNPNVDAVLVTLYTPALYQQEDDGDLVGSSIAYRLEWKSSKDEDWRKLQGGDLALSGKCVSPYQWAHRIELPRPELAEGEPYQVSVRVTRLTADNESTRTGNDLYLDSYAEIIDRRVRYADSAVVAFEADSREFGDNLPQTIAFEIAGIKCPLPAGYDPVARTYPDIWDGTWAAERAPTDNPAWIFWYLTTDPDNGLGERGEEPGVDKWELYKIARFCDELVPDGRGDQEPRFRFAGVFNTREAAYDALNALVSTFRGMLFQAEGGLTASADMPADPDILVTPANVIGGKFTYSETGQRSRHSVAIVSWNDPNDGWRLAQEVVEDPELIALIGWVPVNVAPPGCCWQSQANRYGRWALDTEKREPETVSYAAALDHAKAVPGRIISVMDPRRLGIRRGGRLKSASSGAVELDAPVALASGEIYAINLVAPGGGVVRRDVTNPPGEHLVLTLAEPISSADVPPPGAIWQLLGSDATPRQYRVLAVAETEPCVFTVTAVRRDPTKWARIEQGLDVPPPAYSLIPKGELAPPQGPLETREHQVPTGAGYLPGLLVSWSRSPDLRATAYQVQMRRPGHDGWETVAEMTQDLAVAIRAGLCVGGPYSFRVCALDGLGSRWSSWLLSGGVWIEGKTQPPSNVLTLRTRVEQGGVVLAWERVPDVDAAAYEVRLGADWLSAPTLWRGQALSTPPLPLFAPGSHVLQVKAFDQHGNESLVPASATVEIHAPGAPTVAYALVGDVVRFSVSPVAGSYPLAGTTLTDGDASWEAGVGAFDVPVSWAGPRVFTAASRDVHGNAGPARVVEVSVAGVAAPTGLVATSLPYSVHLAVAAPLSPWLEAVEIWESATNERAGAAKVGETTSGEFTRSGLPLVAARYYWARCRDKFGSLTAFYPSGAGMRGETLSDPAYFTDVLAGQLSEDQLTQALQDRLDGFDGGSPFVDDGFVEPGFFATLAEESLGLTAKGASVEERMQILEDLDGGLYALYLLRLDVNGHVVGMGMMNDGEYGVIAFQADKFLVAAPGEDASLAPFYVGPLPGGGTGVVIRGDLVARGSILAQSLAVEYLSAISADLGEITAGRLTTGDLEVSEGGRVVVGDQNVIIDSDTDSIIIAPNGGPVAGNDYFRLDRGSLLFRYWDAAANAHQDYDPLVRIEDGVANSGDWVFIPGLWREQPRVRVSLNTLLGYDPAYAGQPQTWNVRAEGLTEHQPRRWKFQAVARLELGGANGEKGVNLDSGSSAAASWTSAEAVTPANCAATTVNVQFSSVRGTGTAPNYYARRVRWRVGYAQAQGGPYAWTDYQTKNVGATLGLVSDSRAVNFGAAETWRYVVEFIAEDAGGTFQSGTGGYEYNPTPATASMTGQSAQANAAANWPASHDLKTTTLNTPAISVPSGWEAYRVIYDFRHAYGISGLIYYNSVSGQASPTGNSAQVSIPGQTFTTEAAASWRDGSWETTELVSQLSASAEVWRASGTYGVAAQVILANIRATAYFRRPIANSAAAVNQFISRSMAYALSTATILAQGSCNWLAIGK